MTYRGHGQYCPLALALEMLGPKWTVLVVSRLLDGCSRFNEIHRGLPQMSPSLLSRRLSELEHAGLIRARPLPTGRGSNYQLTEAGRELEPIVDLLAVWGQRWGRDMQPEDLDPAFLVWSMHLRVDPSVLPVERTVIEFAFTGSPTSCREFWLVHEGDHVEMCLRDPGLEPDVAVRADLQVFVEAWRGFRDLRAEVEAGRIEIHGPDALVRAIPSFLLGSSLAPYRRLRPGREKRLADRISRPDTRDSPPMRGGA